MHRISKLNSETFVFSHMIQQLRFCLSSGSRKDSGPSSKKPRIMDFFFFTPDTTKDYSLLPWQPRSGKCSKSSDCGLDVTVLRWRLRSRRQGVIGMLNPQIAPDAASPVVECLLLLISWRHPVTLSPSPACRVTAGGKKSRWLELSTLDVTGHQEAVGLEQHLRFERQRAGTPHARTRCVPHAQS